MKRYRGYQLREGEGGLVISFEDEDIDVVADEAAARKVIDEWMWAT